MWTPEIYQQAIRFAAIKHRSQKVQGTMQPYIVHLSNVAMETILAGLKTHGFNFDLAITCALLHDTLEDTSANYNDVLENFGQPVAEGVLALTLNKKIPREERMKDSLERIHQQPKEIWIVKMSDRITNLQPPPWFWSKRKRMQYKDESLQICEVLKEAGAFSAQRLRTKIEEYERYLV